MSRNTRRAAVAKLSGSDMSTTTYPGNFLSREMLERFPKLATFFRTTTRSRRMTRSQTLLYAIVADPEADDVRRTLLIARETATAAAFRTGLVRIVDCAEFMRRNR